MPVRTFALFSAAILGLAACGPTGSVQSSSGVDSCHTRTNFPIGGGFSLVDHTGAAVTEEDFKGEPAIVFFGFTFCPDVCPLGLVRLNQALELLPESTPKPKPVFISIDPERDTVEQLAIYVTNEPFPDTLVGLTGTAEDLQAAAKEFFTAIIRFDDPSSTAGYSFDHSTYLYLMDKDWNFLTYIDGTATPEHISECIATYL